MNTPISLRLLATLVLVLGAAGLTAQEMRFQGRLTGPGPTFAPVTVATSVRFRIYDHPTNVTPVLWEETQTITPSATGVFSTNLGATVPLTGVDFSQTLYLGVRVGTDPEMVPRYMLSATSSAFYANQAGNAQTLGGLARTGFAELTGANFTGNVSTTGVFSGNGSGLTGVNAAQLGGLARTGFAELTGANFTGNVSTTGVFSGNGSGLTGVNAAQLGGLARSGFAELTGATFSGLVTAAGFSTTGTVTAGTLSATTLSAGNFVGGNFVGNGSGLTNINAQTFGGNAIGAFALLGSASNTFSGTLQATTITASSGFVGNLTGNVTGDVSGTSAGFTGNLAGEVSGPQGATVIANNAVTSAKIADGTITGADLSAGINIVTTGNIASRNAALADGDLTWSATAGNAAFLQLPNQTTSNDLIRTPVAGALRYNSGTTSVEVWNGTTWVAGNGYLAGTALTLVGNTFNVSALGITTGLLANDAVTSAKIADGTITGADLDSAINISTSGTITATGGFVGNISGNAAGFTGNLAGEVTGPQGATVIANNAVTSAKILDGTITGADLSAGINISTTGNIVANSFSGSGSGLTGINAFNITGTLVDAQVANDITLNTSAPITGSAGLTISSGGASIAGGLVVSGGSITGNLIGSITGTASGFTGPLAGDVIGTQGATVVTMVGGQTSANIALGVAAANNATNTNTPNRIVIRDASGNFAANTITANLTGDVTGNLSGNATTATTATNALALNGQPDTFYRDAGNLNAGTLAAARLTGTYNIDISGNAATATSATTAGTATLASDSLLLGGLAASDFAQISGAAFTGGITAPQIGLSNGDLTLATTAGNAAFLQLPTEVESDDNLRAPVAGALRYNTGGGLEFWNGTAWVATGTYTNGAGLALTGNSFSIANGGVTAAMLDSAINVVTSGSITATGGFVGNISGTASGFTGNLAGDVTGPQGATVIANGVVTGAKIADGTITGADLAGNISFTTSGTVQANVLSGASATITDGNFVNLVATNVVANNLTFTSATITADLFVGRDLYVARDAFISDDLSVTDTLTVTGHTSLSTLGTSGLATLNSADVTNNATVGGTLGVTGHTSLSTLGTSGLATLNSADVTNNATVGGTLGVTGQITGGNGLAITGAGTVNLSSNVAATTLEASATYTGTVVATADLANMPQVIGSDSHANVTVNTATALAIGRIGNAEDTQAGVNVGSVGHALNSTYQNFGVLALHGDFSDLVTFSDGLGTASAALLAINAAGGASDYGLLISAANNRIIGDLTITGTLSASTTSGTFGSISANSITAVNSLTLNAGGTLSLPGGSVTNAMLANDSIGVSYGSGVSGNATVALGGTLSIQNDGTLSVTGTANQIDVTAGQNPTISISATYGGQTSITTLGTINTGVWNGTPIADNVVDDNLTIDGGVIDNTVIGGATAAAGTFTSLTAVNSLTLNAGGTLSLPGGSVTNAMLANSSLTVTAGTGLTGGGPVSLGGSITIDTAQDISTSATPTFAGLTLSGDLDLDGNNILNVDDISANSFTGDGSALSDLNATSITSGTLNDARLSGNVPLLNAASLTFTGDISANSFTGDGSALSDLNATSITSGTLADARLSGNVPLLNAASLTFTGDITANSFTGDGSALTDLNATSITSGTLNDARLSGNVPLLNAASLTFTGDITANSFTGDGSALSDLNATSITSGTLADARLSSNVPLLNAASLTFTGDITANSFTGDGSALADLNATSITSGTLNDARLSGNVTLKGNTFNGANELVELTGSGALPALNGSALTLLNHDEVRATIEIVSANSVTIAPGSTFVRVTDNGGLGARTGTTLPTLAAGDTGKMVIVSNEDANASIDVNGAAFSIPSNMQRTFVWDGSNWR